MGFLSSLVDRRRAAAAGEDHNGKVASEASGLSKETKSALIYGLRSIIDYELALEPYWEKFEIALQASANSKAEAVGKFIRDNDTLLWKESVARLLSLYTGVSPEVAADVGCGPGISSQMMLETLRPQKLIAVDIIPQALAAANLRLNGSGNVETVLGDARQLDKYVQSPIDLIVMHSVVECVSSDHYELTFRSAKNVLRERGTLLFDMSHESTDTPSLALACAQKLCVVMSRTYAVPALEELASLNPPEETLTSKVEIALHNAGFSSVARSDFVKYASQQQVREHAERLLKALIKYAGDYKRGDHQRLTGQMQHVIDSVCGLLADKQLWHGSSSAFVVVK